MDIESLPSINVSRLERQLIIQEVTKVNGQVSRKSYEKCRLLGKGGFALCYLVRSLETNATAAAKIISKSILKNPRTRYKLENEIKIHKTLHHPNIVELFVSFQDEENVYILLEVCSGESLNELINKRKRFTMPESQQFVTQIVRAVAYLHSRKILHRDLKLGNIFLSEGLDIKLGDFGLATRMQFENEHKRSVCGTPNYIAPEIIMGHGYSYEVDVWSIGVILYTLLIGTPPFETDNVADTYDLIKKNKYTFSESVAIPEQAKILIGHILQKDPSKRPTLDGILESSFMKAGKPKILKELSNVSVTRCSDSEPYPMSPTPLDCQPPQNIQVTQFVESEGGFAYSMTNGFIGVEVDQHPALLHVGSNTYYFIVRIPNQKKDSIQKYDQEDQIPTEFSQLKGKLKAMRYLARDCQQPNQCLVYIRRFIRHRDFYTFRLSNQTVQLKFADGCQVLLNRQLTIYFSMPTTKAPLAGSFDDLMELGSPYFQKKSKYVREMIEVLTAARKSK